MNCLWLCLTLFRVINISGYVETRPFLVWNDSFHLLGYNRGWLEFKQNYDSYGIQIALDGQIAYDSFTAISSLNFNISRLALWLGKENSRITLGKQRVYWGVGKVFRPLDILNRTNYFEPNYERSGNTAVLAHYSLSNLSNIRIILQPKRNLKQILYGIRLGSNFTNNDFGIDLFYQGQEQKLIIGAELSGEVEIGYWLESNYTVFKEKSYLKGSLGLDYSFPANIYTMVEYFYDQSGEINPRDYDYFAWQNGERSTLAQQYLYTSIGIGYDPFFRPAINSIVNLNDYGFIIMPQIMYSLNDNTDILIGVNLIFGVAQTEFRNITPYRGQVYIWLKVYF